MPDTFTGLLILIVLLAPGIGYSAVRRLTYPERERSTFHETASTVFVSTLCLAVVVALFAVLRSQWPNSTPDVGAFVRSPSDYVRDHYREAAAWGLAIITAASCLGAVIGWGLPSPERAHFNSAWREIFVSGWVRAFDEAPAWRWWDPRGWRLRRPSNTTGPVYVGCELVDGSYIAGVLNSFSTEVDETDDREISLVAPLMYRPQGSPTAEPLAMGTVSVSARRIKFVSATYYPRKHIWPELASPEPPSPAPRGTD